MTDRWFGFACQGPITNNFRLTQALSSRMFLSLIVSLSFFRIHLNSCEGVHFYVKKSCHTAAVFFKHGRAVATGEVATMRHEIIIS